MKQVIQSFKTGETILEDVPSPQVRKGTLLIQTTRSLVSLGTERMLVEFGKANLLSKARQQPEKVRQVIDKIKTDGLAPTLKAVFNKLEEPLPLGYCNVGKVIAVGEGVTEFRIGDRVASNGHHAEIVCVPKNLVASIPDEVNDEEACFTVIGSIALQGIRLLNPTFGETIVVVGLGLIGIMAAQLLSANGCRVIGIDIDEEKLKLCEQWKIIPVNARQKSVVQTVQSITNGIGADGVLITASSTGNTIISEAARMSRKRGRIILVGVTELQLNRSEFYEKELSFQVSCSYGPGRYDDGYEKQGIDYPLPFVRWTEKRNFEAVLAAIGSGKIHVKELISEIVPLEEFNNIYGNISSKKTIASILQYSNAALDIHSRTITLKHFSGPKRKGVLGIIGAGNFTKMTMLPALKGSGAVYKYIASAGGVSANALAKKYGFANSTTDLNEILTDAEIDLVAITTRHDSHAHLIVQALAAGKHVFVEKPLALNHDQLTSVINAYEKYQGSITVGFNRRFSPHAIKVKSLLGSAPINAVITINSGFIPANSWVHDIQTGGGRIIGEACHFIDLATFFTGSKVSSVCMNAMGQHPASNTDNASIILRYNNGSNVVINYFSNGSKSYPKERIEVYSQESTAVIDNFRVTSGYGFKNFRRLKTGLDKGHTKQFSQLMDYIRTGENPLCDFDEIVNTTKASFAAVESLICNDWVDVV